MVVYLSMITPIVNAQNNTSFSQLQNATENTGVEKKVLQKTIEPSLTDQTKMSIKGKIDRIEDISQDDFVNLMTTINNLRNMSHA